MRAVFKGIAPGFPAATASEYQPPPEARKRTYSMRYLRGSDKDIGSTTITTRSPICQCIAGRA